LRELGDRASRSGRSCTGRGGIWIHRTSGSIGDKRYAGNGHSAGGDGYAASTTANAWHEPEYNESRHSSARHGAELDRSGDESGRNKSECNYSGHEPEHDARSNTRNDKPEFAELQSDHESEQQPAPAQSGFGSSAPDSSTVGTGC
jgi:hypothetical protein